MNIMRKILNAVGGHPQQVETIEIRPPEPTAAPRGGHPFTMQEASAALETAYPALKPGTPPPPPKDPFEAKWASLRDQYFQVPKATVDLVMEFADLETLKQATVKKLTPLCDAYDALNAQLSDVNLNAVQSFFHKIHAENSKAVAEGNHSAVKPIPSRQHVQDELATRRGQIRSQKQAIVNAARPTIESFVLRIEAAARRLTDKLETEERAAAEKYGVTFSPSVQLQTLALFSLTVARTAINHHGPGASPRRVFPGFEI